MPNFRDRLAATPAAGRHRTFPLGADSAPLVPNFPDRLGRPSTQSQRAAAPNLPDAALACRSRNNRELAQLSSELSRLILTMVVLILPSLALSRESSVFPGSPEARHGQQDCFQGVAVAKQQDMFTDVTLDPTPIEPSATVHDILHAKGGRR